MAGQRHRKANSKGSQRGAQRTAKLDRFNENVRYLTRSGARFNPDSERSVNRAAAKLRQREALERAYSHKVSKRDAEQLKARGFHVSKRGVAIDGPRNARGKKLAGAKMRVAKGGVISWSIKNRRDFVYGFTKKEKKEFAKDPELFTKKILAKLRASNPTLKKSKPSRIQTRLQWGAFRATKDYSPNFFTRSYFASISPEDKSRGSKNKRLDKLTGLHFVVHVPQPKRGKGNAKGRKKK